MFESKIVYYFIQETNKENNISSFIGKGGKYLFDFFDFGWWEIKEYGFLEQTKANSVAKRYNKTRPYATHRVVEKHVIFTTKEEKKKHFIERFIMPYEKEKVINKILDEEE